MLKPILASCLCVAALLAAHPADAQSRCAPRSNIVVNLESRYAEHLAGVGVAGGGTVIVELFVSATGSWTLISTSTSGVSCLVAAGENWESVPPVLGGPT